ncbi:hypothetical protein [Emticicia sp. 17c]|uniref:hypothetical protein n=1 Tax=Emticicia sp. 17c TaxID=3127704 RepID=UPI00301D3E32
MKKIIFFLMLFSNNCFSQTTVLLIYDANGNRISKQLKGSSPNPTVTASPEAVAPSQSSTLVATGCTGGSIQWQPGGLTGNQIVVNPTVTTEYTANCIVVGCANNGFARITVSIIQCETIPITVATSANSVKYGQSVTLYAFGCVNGIVKWSSGQIGSPINVQMYGSSAIYMATCSRDYCPDIGSATILVGGISGCLPGDVMVTKQPGNWHNPNTWICGRIPTINDEVYINHQVSLTNFGYAKTLVMGNGFLVYDNNGTIVLP